MALPNIDTTAALAVKVKELGQLFSAAQQEINMLTSERDELIDALKRWTSTSKHERKEIQEGYEIARLNELVETLQAEARQLRKENEQLLDRQHRSAMAKKLAA